MQKTLAEIMDVLQTRENFTHGVGATDLEIRTVQEELNVELPASYREFLQMYGFAIWFGGVIYGLGNAQVQGFSLDAHVITKAQQRAWPPHFEPFPTNGIIIGDYGGGGFYFLHGATSNRPGMVVEYLHENGGGPESEWPSFLDYLFDYYVQ